MTQFLDVAHTAHWIHRDGAERILARMTDYQELYSFKYVNGHPSNPSRGFQTVTAFGMLADVDNGYPVFLSEMTLITALRTAATSALTARVLARQDSTTMALVGTGSQAESQALAFRAALGIEDLRVRDTDPAAVAKLRRSLEPLDFRITEAASSAEAVDGADIITTCITDKAHNAVVTHDMIASGVHVNAVGGDCPGKTELEAGVLEAGTVFVELPPQTRIEGAIQQMAPDFPVIEFWKVLAGTEAGRTSADDVTIFDSVGFAIADFAALRCARDATAGSDLQSTIDLVADPDDPKDLFSLLTTLSPVR